MRQILKTYQYIIVGGGSAGCLLANRLCANGEKVLLLEAGGSGRGNIWLKIPIGYLFTMGNPQTDWCFVLRENPHLGGRCLDYPRGRVLGGSSAINGMIYMRGQSQDYDQWAQAGNDGWAWQDVLPFFMRHEHNTVVGGGALHGTEGEVWVSELRGKWRVLDAFIEAAEACGIPRSDDFNTGDNFGSGYFHVNQKNGMRQTAAAAFLANASQKPNLTIITGAQGRRVLIENNRAVGVEYQTAQGTEKAMCDGEVILTAGSIGSPHLLQCSGVGAPDVLRDVGVEVQHDLPGVGENLQDHLQIRPVFEVRGVPTLNEMSHQPLRKLWMGMEYVFMRRGPLSSAPSQVGSFAYSSDAEKTPDLQYHVQPLSLDGFGKPLHRQPAFTASVCHLRPRSRGFVRLSAADPLAPPIIDARHLSDEYDRQIAARALRLTREICAAPPLARLIKQELTPGAAAQSDEELIAAAGQYSTTIFHPIGTCKMGNDSMAVVDSRLRVRGIEALRVADASIMPSIVSGNTNAPTLMIAEKAAAMIVEDNTSPTTTKNADVAPQNAGDNVNNG
ncbi:MAG: GMC family oxidoreductase [Gammaproteobacteria bacterium WSBS_2016_MAG_OTU1]